ncbi:UNVERIFIED_CONTAM: hypothetical protein Slati_2963400 [Sesamum latifolium]|uniref:Uncharacterized protein n=1 Tax=Sesamum latifolium TaxID=2727402 RepID=A0AAW2VJH6_9LAMI
MTMPSRAGKTASTLTGSYSKEEAQSQVSRKKELMFIDVKIHGKSICATIVNGTTYNYLASAKVDRLGLVLEK